ncbi:hypothetical protein BS47DRAFT_1371584 [Hydnum rufescens UP504]|uniref:Cation/H+ exchanger transmembrane domain-containing protein n=1 Tax=Hydnum rufescens UP504 TaxID=1448309 RepID=A0A9P6DVU3_9AGAM|nr:hypothetical protein BS47DRAFT_1371584 [Hydnum rufescens UP504]
MHFSPYEASPTHIVYACLGGFVVLFSMISRFAKEKLHVGEVVFATLFGIAIGPSGANIFTPRSWGKMSDATTNEITLEVTRIVLALGVFAIGVELPKAYMAIHWKSLVLTVVPVMAWGWFVSAGLIVALFPSLTYQSALVISACLTPTDPVLAAAIVGGHFADKNVPGHIRKLLAAESAANDGLAYPFLWLPLYLTLDSDTGTAIKDFVTTALLYQVVLGVIVGTVLGYLFNKIMRFAESRGYVGPDSYAIQFVSLSLFTIGLVTIIGSDDLLAAFAAGCAVSWDGHFNEQTEDNAVFAAIVILNCAVFVFIGSWIQFSDMTVPALDITPGRLAAFFFSILFVRRIPPMILLYKIVPDIHSWQEALFCGWFGPMGVGAVFISTLALINLQAPSVVPKHQNELLISAIQPIVAFTILGSILVHGLSISAFSLLKKVNTITTLSRTTTMNNQAPEWLNQTRRSPPAGIQPVGGARSVAFAAAASVDPSSTISLELPIPQVPEASPNTPPVIVDIEVRKKIAFMALVSAVIV